MRNQPVPITSQSEMNELIQQSPAVLLYYYNDSCAPCVALRPKVQEMTEQHFPLMKHAYINAAELPEIAAHSGVFSSPTIIIYFDGKENFRVSKYISIPELSARIGRYYKLIFD